MSHGKADFSKKERPIKLLTTKKLNLAKSLTEVTAHEADSIGFLPRFLTITTLPHSDPKTHEYLRSARFGLNEVTLTISSRFGVPYGITPRRILAWICAEAIKTKCSTIRLGKSQSEFLSNIGVADSSAILNNFKNQAKRLFSSAISVDAVPFKQKSGIQTFEFEQVFIASKANFLWQPHSSSEGALWQCELTLSDEFFNSIMDQAIPIDMRIITKLSSSLAIDIYVLLCWRVSFLKTKVLMPWQELKNRLGSNYPDTTKGMTNFKLNVRKQLKEVLVLQDNFKVNPEKEGLSISPSPLRITKSFKIR